jgi:haloacetate dehalogenase
MDHDLFPGFEERWYETSGGHLYARVGGPRDADALLLIHGFPQSHLEWHGVAPDLARDYRVICLDLKGYGQSSTPKGDGGLTAYTKRTLAHEAVEAMEIEGIRSFSVIGHDRGAQVAYRMALDFPDHVVRLGILDNLPIYAVWDAINANPVQITHWRSMARLEEETEAEVDRDFMIALLKAHTADGTLDAFDPRAMASYEADWAKSAHRHAYAEDYRAGARTDLDDDLADLRDGRTIACPSVVIWGNTFLGAMAQNPAQIWRRSFVPDIVGIELPCGHFIADERPGMTSAGIRYLMALQPRHDAHSPA